MSTYVQLRKKLQITTLALAELASEKSKVLKKKYLNLLLFKVEEPDSEPDPANKGATPNTKSSRLSVFYS